MHSVSINLGYRPYSFKCKGENKWGEDYNDVFSYKF